MSLKLLFDENLNNHVIRGMWRNYPHLSVERVQDVLQKGASDPEILEWAALHLRVLVTQDASTMISYARERLRLGFFMAGLFVLPRPEKFSILLEDLRLLAECSFPGEWNSQILFLPLR